MMALCYYLKGENIKPRNVAEVRLMAGREVKYLTGSNIDKTGRGYFFPRTGTIVGVFRSYIEFENQEFVSIRDIVEMAAMTAPEDL